MTADILWTSAHAPLVVICADGSDPAYLEAAARHGRMPHFRRLRRNGAYALARAAIPSFTNTNNLTIVTGESAAGHGIVGNYFYDCEREAEVMMDHPRFLRCASYFPQLSRQGARVAAITAKDKLRALLAEGWTGVCFSGERAQAATEREHGIDDVPRRVGMRVPDIYSGLMSDFVMACGVYLLKHRLSDVVYLSLTDFVQHTYPPGSAEADAYYARLDRRLGELDRLGAVVVLTADHGMRDKCTPDGAPNVVYLESLLREHLEGPPRVVLPVTDPHVTHHAGLGSFATVYLDQRELVGAAALLAQDDRIDQVLVRDEAARKYELPEDRIGDLVLLSAETTVFGRRPEAHDLSQLHGARLRSHGGLHEATVPLLINRPLPAAAAARAGNLRNADAFAIGLQAASQ